MKIASIIIFNKENKNIILNKEIYNVNDIPFFYRKNTKDLLKFLSKTIAERIENFKICITEKEYAIYALYNNNLVTIIITDKDYPQRIALSILDIISQDAKNINLENILEKYQNPNENDQILIIQKNIEKTKFTMIDNIDNILKRGEKIDDLVAKSNTLSSDSKIFYNNSKKLNSWCSGCIIQ